MQLKQTELPLTAGQYELSFDAQIEGKDSSDIQVTVAGKKSDITVSGKKENKSVKLSLT